MKIYISAGLFFVSIISCFYGDWNQSFDDTSNRLVSRLIDIDPRKYTEDYFGFMQLRKRCLQNVFLRKQIKDMKLSDKEILLLPEEEVILKKRKNNHIYEVFAWEISTLLGIDSCVVPSFALDIGGNQVIMQKMESFDIGEPGTNIPTKAVLQKVSLDNYWKAHFWAYLLGIKDLFGRNIGVNEYGEIRLFDMEGCFEYQNRPRKNKKDFHTGFFMQSLGWPQYRQPLDTATIFSLGRFVDSLACMEDNMRIYLMYRPFSLDMTGFLYRLNKVRSFSLEEGVTFCDFYKFLFPRVSSGLDSLSKIVGKILQKKVDHADALLFLRKKWEKKEMSKQCKKEIEQWMSIYVD